jgi:hypothetical protein
MSLGEDDLQVDAGDNLSGNTCPNGPCIFAEGTNNWVSYSFTQYTPDEIVFSGVYALQGASGSLPVAAGLSLLSSETVFGSTDDDYSHTAALSFTLPQGVSYTSDSGVFLTQTQPSAVPEPSAVWLLLTGVGMVEAFRRLRPSNRWNAGAIRNRRAAR